MEYYEDSLYKEAVPYLKKAAEQGHAGAQCSLGFCYRYGEGVEQNLLKAIKWYRKAAEQEYAPAQYNLGFCYAYGIGVEKDMVKAVEWYRKAAEQGHIGARAILNSLNNYNF